MTGGNPNRLLHYILCYRRTNFLRSVNVPRLISENRWSPASAPSRPARADRRCRSGSVTFPSFHRRSIVTCLFRARFAGSDPSTCLKFRKLDSAASEFTASRRPTNRVSVRQSAEERYGFRTIKRIAITIKIDCFREVIATIMMISESVQQRR